MVRPAQAGTKAPYHHGDLRAALLTAAEAELADRGVEGFTLRGAAKRAGVSHAAPAHHFRDTKAMLTALANVAAERFTRSMTERQGRAAADPRAQFVASGLGYIEFALANPALFKLMFGSEKTAFDDPELAGRGARAFRILVDGVAGVRGGDPLSHPEGLIDIAAAWSVVHGIANLLIAGRMSFLEALLGNDHDGTLSMLIDRALPPD